MQVCRDDYARERALRLAADPDIDTFTIAALRAGQLPVVQRVDNVGIARMATPRGTINDDLVLAYEAVGQRPEVIN